MVGKILHKIDRVMISENEAIDPTRAKRDYGLTPHVVFIRKDGWSLGAPNGFEGAAYKMWANEWTHFCLKPHLELIPIAEYK